LIIKENKFRYYGNFLYIIKNKIIIFTIIIFIGAFCSGYLYHRSGYNLKTLVSLISSPLSITKNYLSSYFSKDRERIVIDIDFEDNEKIRLKRKNAINKGYLEYYKDDWVSGTIRHKNKSIKIDIRLKGLLSDHWEHDYNWSYRIKVKGDNTLFGMKRFSLQHPKTRGYIDEFIFHELLKEFGLISLRYKFINVIINGREQSVYALEENFDKYLIENNRLRDGPIFRFDPDIYVHDTQQGLEPSQFIGTAIYPYNEKKYLTDSTYKKQFDVGRTLLEDFRQGNLKTTEVFDGKKLAVYFAVLDLLGNSHASRLDNLRLYYNPVTSLIEPIGYDNGIIYLLKQETQRPLLGANKQIQLENKIEYNSDWITRVFSDKKFYKEYVKALLLISDKLFLENFFIEKNSLLKNNLKKLHKSYPWYNFDKNILYSNQKFIKQFLNSKKSIHTYLKNDFYKQKKITLGISNIHSIPKEIIGIKIMNDTVIQLDEIIILQARDFSKQLSYRDIVIKVPNEINLEKISLDNIQLLYKNIGTDIIKMENIYPWNELSINVSKITNNKHEKNYLDRPFIITDDSLKIITIRKGNWTLNNDIIFPKGYTINCYGSTNLNLEKNSKIISYSKINFIGSKDYPINIISNDSTGQGLVVINGYENSNLNYVNFNNLAFPNNDYNWTLTGGVTFYESPVIINNVVFSNNNSEDALNIIRSSFQISNSFFKNIKYDAFDGDFVNGTITNSFFDNCSNDAIDVSGSSVNIENIKIYQVGDKAISVGESSNVNIKNINILKSRIGLASKDLSIITADSIYIGFGEIGLAAYQKKREFGSGKIIISNFITDSLKSSYLLEELSIIKLNGFELLHNKSNLYSYLINDK
jgi:hypothetical protein